MMNRPARFLTVAFPVLLLAGCGAIDRPCGRADDPPCLPELFCKLKTGNCDGAGVCTAIPEVCIAVFQPVCGCDGETYGNECFAWAAGVSVAADGPCD